MTMASTSSDYFKKVAPQWDDIRSGYYKDDVRSAAMAKAYLLPGMEVADVGAGTGYISAALAPLVGKVHVLDGSEAMLEEARRNLSSFTNVEYHLADGLALPLPEGCIDAVFANMYLHHCPDPAAAVAEMARLLKPGGRLVITDMEPHTNEWMRAEMADEWMGFEQKQVLAWFEAAGLVNIIVDGSGQNCCVEPPEGSAIRQEKIDIFLAVGTRRAGMRDAVREAYTALAESGSSCCGGDEEGVCGCGSEAKDGAGCCGGEGKEGNCCGGEAHDDAGCCGGESKQGDCCCGDSPEYCCDSAENDPAAVYVDSDLEGVPAEAGDFSLGCGNPNAIASLRPGEVVLDIGSGGGLDAFIAAGRVGQGGRVIGVDMTPAMLARATASAEKSGIQNVEFREGYAEHLPVEDASVDVIMSNCVINLCEDKGQVFREAFRVLKPGGRLAVSDMVCNRGMPAYMRERAGEWAECISGALPEQEYLDLVSAAGFVDVSAQRSRPLQAAEGEIVVYSAAVTARKSAAGEKPPSVCQSCCG